MLSSRQEQTRLLRACLFVLRYALSSARELGNQKSKRSDLQHPTLMIRGIRHLLDSVTVLYGLVVILVMYGAVALFPAESAARYTTAGGHYH